jgi:hypothetical protein
MKYFVQLIAVLSWISGIVIAQGFFSTTFAFVMPVYAWYLFVERVLQHIGII